MICTAVLSALVVSVFFMPCFSVLGLELPDPEKPLSLTVTLKSQDDGTRYAAGADVTIYKVADCIITDGSITFVLNEDYAGSGFDPEGRITQSVIDGLVKFTEKNNIKGLTKKTGADGKAVFEGLTGGVYLVTAKGLPEGFSSFVPFVYYLPYTDQDTGEWRYDGTAEPKLTYYKPVSVSVRKVWNDDNSNRPQSVTVQLINEDGVYDTVTLNQGNGWKYEWTNMRPDKDWSVKEINIPADYKATYSSSGYSFTVTNTYQLIQTGQLKWPVPVMVFSGAFLICAGILVKLPGKKNDEE